MWIATILLVFLGALLLSSLRFTIVQEGTAKAIIRAGAFKKIVMAWEDYELDEEWNVRSVQNRSTGKLHILGGLRFVGIRFLDEVYIYKFRWQGIKIRDGQEIIEFNEKTIDYIWVRPDVYWTKISKAETGPIKKPQRIPVDVQWLITMRVVNPHKALFKAPSNWLENVLSRSNALFRDWVATKSLNEVLAFRKEPENLLEEIKGFGRELITEVFEEEWGVLVEGIQIRDVDLPPEYAEAAASEKKAKLESGARAEKIMGTVFMSIARAGQSEIKAQKEFEKDPKAFSEKHKDLFVQVMTKLSMEEKAYSRVEVLGSSGGFTEEILKVIAAYQMMSQAQREGQKEQKEQKEKEKVKITKEDIERVKKKYY